MKEELVGVYAFRRNNLIKLRDERFAGSQRKLAEALGIKPQNISCYCRGVKPMGPRRAREIEKTFNLGTGEMDREVTVVDRQQSELPVMAASEALDWLGCDHGNCVPESTNRAPAVGEHLPGSFYLVLEDDVDSQLARSGDWLLMTAGEPKNCSSKMLVYAAVEGYRPMLCWYRRQLDKVDLWNDSFKKSFDARQVGVRVVAYGTTTIRPHRTMGFAVRPGQ